MTHKPRILIVFSDKEVVHLLERNILAPEGYQVLASNNCQEAEKQFHSIHPDLMIIGDDLPDGDHLEFSAKLIDSQPTLPVILFTKQESDISAKQILRLGLVDWLTAPLHADEVIDAVHRGLERSQQWGKWLKLETRRQTGALEKRVNELETLAQVGQAVTAELDLDRVLTTVVETAVSYCEAEEGSLLLLDEASGELYMRAGKNFQDEFVTTFRLPVEDTLAGGVIRSGDAVMVNPDSPHKILTSYLVYSVIYVPLKVHGGTIGVLGVDNRSKGSPFDQQHLTFLSALADYAAIAIDNAQLYSNTEIERSKLESILTQIDDGVLVLDEAGAVILANHTVRKAFDLGEINLQGQKLEAVFTKNDLIDAVLGKVEAPLLPEIEAEGGHIYNIQATDIPGVGRVAAFHDITYLKELDRVKSDFVNAVSHDLRSPLTAIVGYVELIERLGEVNDKQAECIQRVQTSVDAITALITDLLDLGRIEVGLDEKIEVLDFASILDPALEAIAGQMAEKGQQCRTDYQSPLPNIIGDKIQLRQLVDNMLGNAVKYTPQGGQISLSAKSDDGSLILQVADSGIGIPLQDQPRIFDRFYRASNTPQEVHGTGLGLAIVKTIVENHRGRIWVESSQEKGSTFTIVFPAAELE